MCFKWGLKEEDRNASIGISISFICQIALL